MGVDAGNGMGAGVGAGVGTRMDGYRCGSGVRDSEGSCSCTDWDRDRGRGRGGYLLGVRVQVWEA